MSAPATKVTGSVRLTDPVEIALRTAPSRVIFGPHETNLGRGRAIGDRHVAYYERRAAGGAGLIVTETASVTADDHPYERAPLAAECEAGWAAVATACRPYATLVLAGLGHAGGQGSSAFSQSVLWAPSPVADAVSRELPAEMEQEQIDAVVAGFADAARAAVRSGLDGVEVDAGVFSLLRQFHSGLTNQRGDGYGTDRLRLTREVLAAVRDAIGTGRILSLRLCCDELAPWAGVTPEQAADQVAALADAVDLLVVVRGGPFSTSAYRPDGHAEPGFNLDLVRAMREAAAGRVPVVLQGSVVDPAAAQAALDDGAADLVEMTRAQIADARLVALVRAGVPERIRPCVLCNQACRVRDNRNPIVSCVADPRSGHETEDQPADDLDSVASSPPPATSPQNTEAGDVAPEVLVVGAGPAGLECARVLAGLGWRVQVAEAAARTGGALRVAAVGGPARERLALLADWLDAECRRLGVDIVLKTEITAGHLGSPAPAAPSPAAAPSAATVPPAVTASPAATVPPAVTASPAATATSDVTTGAMGAAGTGGANGPLVVLATGARPGPPPVAAPAPVTARTPDEGAEAALSIVGVRDLCAVGPRGLPPGPVVVDDPIGGPAGVAAAEWLAAEGREVALVTPDQIAGTMLALTGDLADANSRLQRAGVRRVLRSRLRGADPAAGRVAVEHVWTGERSELPCAVLVDAGFELPEESLYLARPGTPRAGDCVAPRTVLEAVLEGRRRAFEIAGTPTAAPPSPPREAARSQPVP